MARISVKCLAGAMGLTLALAGQSASAGSGPWLFGDWGGERTRLQDQGIDFQFGYASETAYNANGGSRHGTRYADQFVFGTTLDLQRLFGLPNARFQATMTERNGKDLGADADLGTLQQVQEIWGRGQTWRLTDFWYEQQLFDKVVDVKLGRMGVGEDFASFACDFQNLTFCGSAPGNIVGNYWYNWPVSQWAGRVKVSLPRDSYVQVGVYQVNSNYLTLRYASDPGNPPGTTGVLLPLEFGWNPTFRGKQGTYKAGGWYKTSKSDDVFHDVNGEPRILTGQPALQRNGSYGAYFMASQQVMQFSPGADPGRGLSVFFNATQADRATSTVDSQVATGIVSTGLIPGRPKDDFAIAAGRTHVNSRVKDGEELAASTALQPVAIQHSEYVVETFYSWHALAGLVVRPNLQYVRDPGGVNDRSGVVVTGLKVVANF